jgi:hypothetical protein
MIVQYWYQISTKYYASGIQNCATVAMLRLAGLRRPVVCDARSRSCCPVPV